MGGGDDDADWFTALTPTPARFGHVEMDQSAALEGLGADAVHSRHAGNAAEMHMHIWTCVYIHFVHACTDTHRHAHNVALISVLRAWDRHGSHETHLPV